ncbi:MAG: metallophosphoesterase, partial [Clostridia bacterium]|nr:metallophosphoesterase [Clostridia bacterium]
AVSGGKVCIALDASGHVYVYAGVQHGNSDATLRVPTFVDNANYDEDGTLVIEYVQFYSDGTVETFYREANLSGTGGGSGLPEPAGPHMALVTDSDGNVSWKEQLAYEYGITAEIIPESEVVIAEADLDGVVIGLIETEPSQALVAEKKYIVTWNGVEYECTAQVFEEDGIVTAMVGNASLMEGTGNSGEPFIIIYAPPEMTGEDFYFFVYILDGSTENKVKIAEDDTFVKPIDKKYLGELRGQKKIVLTPNEDKISFTASCSFAEAWAMDEGELQNAICIESEYSREAVYAVSKIVAGDIRAIQMVCMGFNDYEHFETPILQWYASNGRFVGVYSQRGLMPKNNSYEEAIPVLDAESGYANAIPLSEVKERLDIAPFIVTIEHTADGYTADHYQDEIIAAYESGRVVYAMLSTAIFQLSGYSTTQGCNFVLLDAFEEMGETLPWMMRFVITTDSVLFETNTLLTASDKTEIKQELVSLSEEIANIGDDAIPNYWEEHLKEKIRRVQTLQRNGGKDSYSFVVLTDFHHSDNRNHYSPELIKKIMDDCGIKFCLCLGDTQNGGAWDTKELELADWDGIDKKFRPIYDRTLMTQGNHDGAYGKADMNGDGKIEGVTDYYIYNLTNGEVYDLMFRKVSLINGVKFDAEKFGYYVDEPISNVRYILVNTHYSDGAVNDDGTPVNNFMRKTRIGQSQMNMVIEALQSIQGNDWHVVIGSHFPLARVYDSGGEADLALLRGMLEAFQSKTTYSNTYGTVGNYDYVSVDVDFAQAKGRVLAAFGGHVHGDGQNMDYSFPIITSASDNTDNVKVSNGDSYTVVSGEQGTITEQSFDVFTVDRQAGFIYATKIGFGEDRMFAIGDAYSVSLNLDGATASNTDTVVSKYAAYHNQIIPQSGNLLNTVVVTMGGVDVTADVYADGIINIDSVTGDIVVTVTTKYAYTNLADTSSPDWRSEEGYINGDGVFQEEANGTYNKTLFVSNFIPVTKGDVLRVKGFDRDELTAGIVARLAFYDENKEYVHRIMLNTQNAGKADALTSAASASLDETGVLTFDVLVRGDSGMQFTYNNYCDRAKYVRVSAHWLTTEEDIVVTVNEEIV